MDNRPEDLNAQVAEPRLLGPALTCAGKEEAGGRKEVQDATLPLNGLVLSEEFPQSLGACGLKVVALEQEKTDPWSPAPAHPAGPWSVSG